jgi:hypothetical protein
MNVRAFEQGSNAWGNFDISNFILHTNIQIPNPYDPNARPLRRWKIIQVFRNDVMVSGIRLELNSVGMTLRLGVTNL